MFFKKNKKTKERRKKERRKELDEKGFRKLIESDEPDRRLWKDRRVNK